MVVGHGANIFCMPPTLALNTSEHSCALHAHTHTHGHTLSYRELILQGWTGHREYQDFSRWTDQKWADGRFYLFIYFSAVPCLATAVNYQIITAGCPLGPS